MAKVKESKSRKPVTADHPCIAAAILVLLEDGEPLTSVFIFRRAVRMRLLDEGQYNSLRSRLSQHCDQPGAVIARAPGSKVGLRGSRGPGWVLTSAGRTLARKRRDPIEVIARGGRRAARRRRRLTA